MLSLMLIASSVTLPILGHHVSGALDGQEGERLACRRIRLEVAGNLAIGAAPRRPLARLVEPEALVDPRRIPHVTENVVGVSARREGGWCAREIVAGRRSAREEPHPL